MLYKRILLLAGTGLARDAAVHLTKAGFTVISSLAGVTSKPLVPKGELRVGGFGGVEGLKDFLTNQNIDLVVEATHAFATKISAHAFAACQALNVPIIRLAAKPWPNEPHWLNINSIPDAVSLLPQNARVAVTIGRKEITGFFARNDLDGKARMIEAPEGQVPANWEIILQRPPFSLAEELTWLDGAAFLVTKNAGGTRPSKLDAAAELGLKVIMIAQPIKPEIASFFTFEDLLGSITSTRYLARE